MIPTTAEEETLKRSFEQVSLEDDLPILAAIYRTLDERAKVRAWLDRQAAQALARAGFPS